MSDEPPAVNDQTPPPTEAERTAVPRLAALKLQHQDLDDAIHALTLHPRPDQLQIARLKKQKLLLRDRIVVLEDQMTPDIIA